MVIFFDKIANAITEDKIRMMCVEKLRFDEVFKGVFTQEPEKVERISEDMKANGFDRSQPIIITEDNLIIDGNSRFMAAQKAGIKKVPVIVKHFESKEEALIYEYNLQLNRRNLKDSEIFAAFQKLDELRTESGERAKTNADIAEQLSISERQVSKLREVMKKASATVIEKLKSGDLTLNRAYVEMKGEEKAEEAMKSENKSIIQPYEQGFAEIPDDYLFENEIGDEKEAKGALEFTKNKKKKIDIESFTLGIKFALGEFGKNISNEELFGNNVLLGLGISSRRPAYDEQVRIEQDLGLRFSA